LAITLKVEEQGKRTAAMNVTTKDWAVGTDEAMDAIRFILPTHPTTGEPSITKFTVTKNGAEPTVYEYSAGVWSATPDFFLVEDTEATDVFAATATVGGEDAISGLTDELVAGPATMNAQGIIDLEFSHTKATLTVRVYKGDGATGDVSTAEVNYQGIDFAGAENTFIIEPKNFAKGDAMAAVVLDGNTYEVVADKAISFAAGTTNKLAITLKVEVQGKRTAGLNVTTKDWVAGTDAAATGTHVVIPAGPSDGNTEVAEFTLYKNMGEDNQQSVAYKLNAAGTAYQPKDGAAPFYMEDVVAGDTFTGKYIGAADAITNVEDIIQTPAVAMTNEGIINLAFAHTNAKLTLNLEPGTAFSGNLDNAVVKLLNYNATVTGASHTFIMTPNTYQTGDAIATITLAGKVYTAKLTAEMTLTAGKHTVLTVTLAPTAVNISVAVVNWADGASATAQTEVTVSDITGLPATPGTLTLASAGLTATYAWDGTSLTANGNSLYWEDLYTGAATYNFELTFTPTAKDAVTDVKDILNGTAEAAYNVAPQFDLAHTNARLLVKLVKGANFDRSLETAEVKLLDYTKTATGKDTEFIMTPQTIDAGTKIVTVTLDDMTYTAKLNADMTLSAGKATTLTLTLNPTGVNMNVNVTNWADGGSTGGDLELE
ncbi:fimbrillin family protein, partial [Bacteroides sp. OttesenSCG-928-D19]|nr:fimbrillin family protein [Bacteroides sp. OttesenSCG-928-D19]